MEHLQYMCSPLSWSWSWSHLDTWDTEQYLSLLWQRLCSLWSPHCSTVFILLHCLTVARRFHHLFITRRLLLLRRRLRRSRRWLRWSRRWSTWSWWWWSRGKNVCYLWYPRLHMLPGLAHLLLHLPRFLPLSSRTRLCINQSEVSIGRYQPIISQFHLCQHTKRGPGDPDPSDTSSEPRPSCLC